MSHLMPLVNFQVVLPPTVVRHYNLLYPLPGMEDWPKQTLTLLPRRKIQKFGVQNLFGVQSHAQPCVPRNPEPPVGNHDVSGSRCILCSRPEAPVVSTGEIVRWVDTVGDESVLPRCSFGTSTDLVINSQTDKNQGMCEGLVTFLSGFFQLVFFFLAM